MCQQSVLFVRCSERRPTDVTEDPFFLCICFVFQIPLCPSGRPSISNLWGWGGGLRSFFEDVGASCRTPPHPTHTPPSAGGNPTLGEGV